MKKIITFLLTFVLAIHQTNCEDDSDDLTTFLNSLWKDLQDGNITSYSTHENVQSHKPTLPEALMSTIEIIHYHGYPGEEHVVITEDGFVITIHRIPFGIQNKNVARPPVIIQHGFLCTSSCWVLNLPEQNLPYILADYGFDVWLGNIRGSKYGKENLYLNQSQVEYWKFSFHEMAIYDLTAVVNYILNNTKAEKLFYIGHSMGGTMIFSLLSTKPEYNQKFKRIFAVAPAVYLNHMKTPIYPYLLLIEFYLKFFGINAIYAEDISSWVHSVENSVTNTAFAKLGADLLCTVFGCNPKQLNLSRISLYFHHVPCTNSAQTFLHLMQLIKTGSFAQYDYGIQENLRRYGQVDPPEYDLSRIDCPILLYSSFNDLAVNNKDVANLATNVRTVIGDFVVSDRKFAHHDFIWGINAREILYDNIIYWMKLK